MNVCGACDLDFLGVRDFDSHRVGKHDYTFWEGLRMRPPRADGRRCISRQELIEDGWHQDERGRWAHPRRRYDSVTSSRRAISGRKKAAAP